MVFAGRLKTCPTASMFAIRLALVTIPSRAAWAIARFVERQIPRSSALTMSVRATSRSRVAMGRMEAEDCRGLRFGQLPACSKPINSLVK